MRVGKVARTLAELPQMLKLAKEVKPRSPATRDCFAARVEATAERYPERTAIIFEDDRISWRELNARANRYAASFRQLG
ncbi:MAG: hypothetical protein KDI05_04920, partial [Halieaceae bacterium]|nr:hypothetical protein [Halieaceae bacterium]